MGRVAENASRLVSSETPGIVLALLEGKLMCDLNGNDRDGQSENEILWTEEVL